MLQLWQTLSFTTSKSKRDSTILVNFSMPLLGEVEFEIEKRKQGNLHGWGWDERAKSEVCDVVTHVVYFWNLARGLPILEISKSKQSEVLQNTAPSTSATGRAPSTNKTASMAGVATCSRPRLNPVMLVTSLHTLRYLPSNLLLPISKGAEACRYITKCNPIVQDQQTWRA